MSTRQGNSAFASLSEVASEAAALPNVFSLPGPGATEACAITRAFRRRAFLRSAPGVRRGRVHRQGDTAMSSTDLQVIATAIRNAAVLYRSEGPERAQMALSLQIGRHLWQGRAPRVRLRFMQRDDVQRPRGAEMHGAQCFQTKRAPRRSASLTESHSKQHDAS